jgi:Skp family chaperone for outer membrane proteins
MIQALRSHDEAESKPPSHGAGETAIMHGLQGATGGYSDEIAGGVEAAGRAIGLKGLGGSFSDVGVAEDGPTLDWETLRDAYRSARDKKRGILKEQAKQRPAVAATSNVAGAVISPVNKLAKGMSLAKGGAVIGGITGLGQSEAKDLKGMAADTALGAGTGLVVGKGIDKAAEIATPIVNKVAEKVGGKTREIAERLAARAIGAERGTIKKIGQKEVQAAGAQVLDRGVLSPLASTDDLIARNEGVKKAAMNARKAAYDKIDDVGGSTFNPLEVAAKAEEKVVGGLNRSHQDVQELVQTLEPHVQNILSRGESNISMAEAQDLVEALGKKAKFDTSRSQQANEVAKSVYHSVRDSINEAAEKGADKIGAPGLRKIIENANKTYQHGKTASTLLKNKQAREQGNKFFGLTDTITGGAALGYGGATGDWETAAGVVAAKKGLQKYGAQNAALLLNKVAKGIATPANISKLAQANPGIAGAAISRFTRTANDAVGRAADQRPEKGPERWAADGFDNIVEHSSPDKRAVLEKMRGEMLKNPKLKELLIKASDLKPGSKALDKLLTEILGQKPDLATMEE